MLPAFHQLDNENNILIETWFETIFDMICQMSQIINLIAEEKELQERIRNEQNTNLQIYLF